MAVKERLDVLLVERGLCETREKAKRTIMAGLVYSDSERLDKPGMKVAVDMPLRIKGEQMPYVSRGGLKLEKALQTFDFPIAGKVGLDIGASTGGFTDCALQHGAEHMYAVDVGYNQLAWKIRQDERVTVMERMNFRHAVPSDFGNGIPQFATIDVSFISLRLMLPPLFAIIAAGGDVCALIKPQFEAGKDQVGKKGIVRDPAIHEQVIESIAAFSCSIGFDVVNLSYSPITGGEGNIEFLIHLQKGSGRMDIKEGVIRQVVESSQRLKNH